MGGFAFEPTIGLEYVRSSLDDLEVLKQSVSFDDHQGFAARIGARAIARTELEGRAFVWTAGLEATHDFDAEYAGALHSKGQTDAVSIAGPETFGRARIGLQYEVGNDLETYIQGEGRFGDGESGGGLRIGARYRF